MTGMRHGKAFEQEEMIKNMTKDGFEKSIFKTYREADEALAKKYCKRKDYNDMINLKNITVCIDGDYYKPRNGVAAVRVGEHPTFDLQVEMDPLYKINEGPGRAYRIKDVIFNPPATIVFWVDGTKTVVKTQYDEPFDPEKGLAMAIAKKALGNQGNYFETIKKYVAPYNEREMEIAKEAFAGFLEILNSTFPEEQSDT
jgi:hypothetical protein